MTAAHVVRDATGAFIESRYEPDVERGLELIYYDEVADIAILLPTTEIETIKPIKLRTAKPKHMSVGTKTIYSGYPNNHSMLTIHGRIAGFTSDADLIIDTYGWGGASGSSVFDEKGRLLGILSAMDVGTGLYGMPRLIPDVIIIIPVTKIDFDALDLLLEIIEGQLDDIKELEAENNELWKLLDDIKESESITHTVLDVTRPLTPEVIAGFYDPIDE